MVLAEALLTDLHDVGAGGVHIHGQILCEQADCLVGNIRATGDIEVVNKLAHPPAG